MDNHTLKHGQDRIIIAETFQTWNFEMVCEMQDNADYVVNDYAPFRFCAYASATCNRPGTEYRARGSHGRAM